MAVEIESIRLPVRAGTGSLNTRLLGAAGMLASPMLVVPFVLERRGLIGAEPVGTGLHTLVSVLGIVYLAGWMCSAVALRRLRVTGESRFSAAILPIQLTGLLLAVTCNLMELTQIGLHTPLFFAIDAFWPLSHLFMLVVAAMIVKAGVWRGWRRVPAFLCGLALPSFFLTAFALGARDLGGTFFCSLTLMGFLSLGYAIYSDPRADSTA